MSQSTRHQQRRRRGRRRPDHLVPRTARGRRRRPGATSATRATGPRPLAGAARVPRDLAGQQLPRPVAVDQQAAERRQRPEHDEEVEQAGAGVDEVVAVEGEQQRGDGAEQRRPEQPPGDPADHEDRQRAHDGRREPPAERAGRSRTAARRSAIIHLPTGGWTTKSAWSLKTFEVAGGEVLVGGLMSERQASSSPNWRSGPAPA